MAEILKNKKRILIIRLSSLGDILLTTPLIRSIKSRYPNITIDFLLKEQYQNTLKQNKYISNLFLYEDGQKILQQNNYDLIIDLHNNFRSRKVVNNLGVYSLQFKKNNFKKFLLVNLRINRLRSFPQIPVRYASTIPNFKLDDKGLDVFLPNDIKPNLKDGNKYIGFAPGSRHYTKMWPLEYYIELGKLLSENGYKIVLFGGKNDKQVCDKIKLDLSSSINLSNNDDLFKTAIDMKECSAIICNDSGLMHLVCGLKIPVLTIFGSTVKEFGFTPYKNQNVILENNSLNCRPCSHIGRSSCPKKHFNCMKELTPQLAYSKLKELLAL